MHHGHLPFLPFLLCCLILVEFNLAPTFKHQPLEQMHKIVRYGPEENEREHRRLAQDIPSEHSHPAQRTTDTSAVLPTDGMQAFALSAITATCFESTAVVVSLLWLPQGVKPAVKFGTSSQYFKC